MWTYHNLVRVTAGNGSVSPLPALLAGRSCLLLTFPEAESLGEHADVPMCRCADVPMCRCADVPMCR